MPIYQRDVLLNPTGTVDIGLIRDKANVEAPRRGTRVDLQALSENLDYTVEKSHGCKPSTTDPIDTTPTESAPKTSRARSTSQFTPPSAALVPIALLHHIHPWIQ